MERTQSSRRLQPVKNPLSSPRLLRSRSSTSAADEFSSPYISKSTLRPKSTTKLRRNKDDDENLNPLTRSLGQRKNPLDSEEGFGRFLRRNNTERSPEVSKRTISPSASPSAWALSPGRWSTCSVVVPKSPAGSTVKLKAESGGGGGGMSKLLKYFKQKKVSTLQKEEFHRFRIMHNRLLQWRFVNARVEAAAMASVKIVSTRRLFNVWIRIFKLRNSVVEKRIQLQRFKDDIKLRNVINTQAHLLKECASLEPINLEAVGRMARELKATSITVPLVHGSKADALAVNNAISTVERVMDSMESTIIKFQFQVEYTCYILTELSVIVKLQSEYLEELEKGIAIVAALEEEERALRIHVIQLVEGCQGQVKETKFLQ